MSGAPDTRYVRTTIVCVRDRALLGFFGQDPLTGRRIFFLPGGKPEAGESLVEAARREALEETGYLVRPLPETELVADYDLIWGGEPWPCTTHFFAAELEASPEADFAIHDATYHRGVAWVDLDELDEHLDYSAVVLDAVRRLLARPAGATPTTGE